MTYLSGWTSCLQKIIFVDRKTDRQTQTTNWSESLYIPFLHQTICPSEAICSYSSVKTAIYLLILTYLTSLIQDQVIYVWRTGCNCRSTKGSGKWEHCCPDLVHQVRPPVPPDQVVLPEGQESSTRCSCGASGSRQRKHWGSTYLLFINSTNQLSHFTMTSLFVELVLASLNGKV